MRLEFLLSPLIALLGVYLGGRLSLRSQERGWTRDDMHRWRSSRLETYGKYVAAAREFRTYALRSDAKIRAFRHPDRTRVLAALEEDGAAQQQSLESVLGQVKMVAQSQDTVNAAMFYARVLRRFAAACAVHSVDEVPAALWERVFTAETEFVNAARREVSLIELSPPDYAKEAGEDRRSKELVTIDDDLNRAFGNRT